jgi:hypothetical protein
VVQPAVAFETVLTDPDDDVLALETPHQERARQGKPRVSRRRDARLDGARFVQRFLQKVLRRADAEVGIVRNLQRSTAGAFGEATLDVRLDAPGDSPE